MLTDTITATTERSFPISGYGKGAQITITACAYAPVDQSPRFSVTAEVFARRFGRMDVMACGCMHDDAVRVWPAIAPIVALHLSDAATGAPMHAEANGWYWASGAREGRYGERYHGGSDKSADECLALWEATDPQCPLERKGGAPRTGMKEPAGPPRPEATTLPPGMAGGE